MIVKSGIFLYNPRRDVSRNANTALKLAELAGI